jgi:CRISPR-associated exonuclease Cas4
MTFYAEEDFLQLSGIQHFAFCRRQWALIHIENLWAENYQTTDGALMHKKAHNPDIKESRRDLCVMRSVSVYSRTLGITGQCDVVEFYKNACGIQLNGKDGLWIPYPVEYKRGEPKPNDCDALQLCAQAMCLEQMLCCSIEEGALYYGQTKRRQTISLTEDLRMRVEEMTREMHSYAKRGYTPKVKPVKACNACSMKELCMPKLLQKKSAMAYLQDAVVDEL